MSLWCWKRAKSRFWENRALCESSLDHGFHTIVPVEAVGGRCLSAHLTSLLDIDARYAYAMPISDVLAHLQPLVAI